MVEKNEEDEDGGRRRRSNTCESEISRFQSPTRIDSTPIQKYNIKVAFEWIECINVNRGSRDMAEESTRRNKRIQLATIAMLAAAKSIIIVFVGDSKLST